MVDPGDGSWTLACPTPPFTSPRALAVGETGIVYAIDGATVVDVDPASACASSFTASGGDLVDPIDLALERGVNFFDTADVYGGGHSEELLGKAMQGRREQFIVATKIGWQGFSDEAQSSAYTTVEKLIAGVESNLQRLQTDYVDVIQSHIVEYRSFPYDFGGSCPALKPVDEGRGASVRSVARREPPGELVFDARGRRRARGAPPHRC